MTTAFSIITAAVVAALEADPPVSENIFRARDRSIVEEVENAVNVEFAGAIPEAGAIAGAPVDWRTRIVIECYARTSISSPDVVVDPLLENVFARMAADTTLGGLVVDVGYPTVEAENDAQAQKTGWIRLVFTILHRTNNLTLESP